jgi:hypothetical protein
MIQNKNSHTFPPSPVQQFLNLFQLLSVERKLAEKIVSAATNFFILGRSLLKQIKFVCAPLQLTEK